MPSSPNTKASPGPEEEAKSAKAVPFGRMGTAEDLTGMAIFLATDEAKYIVAQARDMRAVPTVGNGRQFPGRSPSAGKGRRDIH
jgi:NAD(P)-dependent dehydrogenase (short-subunit alcohol dehydrogenase family)